MRLNTNPNPTAIPCPSLATIRVSALVAITTQPITARERFAGQRAARANGGRLARKGSVAPELPPPSVASKCTARMFSPMPATTKVEMVANWPQRRRQNAGAAASRTRFDTVPKSPPSCTTTEVSRQAGSDRVSVAMQSAIDPRKGDLYHRRNRYAQPDDPSGRRNIPPRQPPLDHWCDGQQSYRDDGSKGEREERARSGRIHHPRLQRDVVARP